MSTRALFVLAVALAPWATSVGQPTADPQPADPGSAPSCDTLCRKRLFMRMRTGTCIRFEPTPDCVLCNGVLGNGYCTKTDSSDSSLSCQNALGEKLVFWIDECEAVCPVVNNKASEAIDPESVFSKVFGMGNNTCRGTSNGSSDPPNPLPEPTSP